MRYETFLRNHTETVVLGLPETPVRYLQSLCKICGRRAFLLCPGLLFPFHLLPFARVLPTASRFSDILLMELTDFAAKNEGKRLTLIPATEEAISFAKANVDALEADYVIRWTSPKQGEHDYESA